MTALLNELVDEAIERSSAFAGQAAEMRSAAGETAERLRALVDGLREKGAESHALFAEATTKLRLADERLAGAEGRAASEMEELRSRLGGIHHTLAALVTAASSGAADLTAGKATLLAELDRHQAEIAAHTDRGLRSVQSCEARVGERLTAVREALSALQQAAADTQQSLLGATSALTENLQQLSDRAREHARAEVEAVAEAADQASSTLVQAANTVIDAHNRTMDIIRDRVQGEACGLAESVLLALFDTAHALEAQCATRHPAVTSEETVAQALLLAEAAERIDLPLAEAARLRP